MCLSRFAELNKKGESLTHSRATSQLAVGLLLLTRHTEQDVKPYHLLVAS